MTQEAHGGLKSLPQVERVLQREELHPYGRVLGFPDVKAIIRLELEKWRRLIREGRSYSDEDFFKGLLESLERRTLDRLRRVINATGVVIHTNLGRTPLSSRILTDLAAEMSGYCNLELRLVERRRGGRGAFAEDLVKHCTGAEDAIIVNNNAASVFLILNEFARGREVIVSRGELIQIGGGFRIPDIMAQSGAKLVEVGTTNITTIDDFRSAITTDTAMIFSAHRSNFRMEGFTEDPALSELAGLKTDSLLFIRDLGSGNLFPMGDLPSPHEPTVREELSQGPDLVCFSGDKLLGGAQAGIIVGRADLVKRLRKNPLMRMLRVDKVTYYILQETFLAYLRNDRENLPLWAMLQQKKKDVEKRVRRFIRLLPDAVRDHVNPVGTMATIGGGSMPGYTMESAGITVVFPGIAPDELADRLSRAGVPVMGVVSEGRYILDFFTVMDHDLGDLAQSLLGACSDLER